MEGLRIKAIRKALKLSQSKLAAVLKVTRNTVSTWEIGQMSPTPVNLARIDDYARKKRLDLKKFPLYCPDCNKIGKLCEEHSGKKK
jgi:transcriptional regulator with XRE-family HTH domain